MHHCVLQVAYDRSLLMSREGVLKFNGIEVISALGNREAMELDPEIIAKANAFIIGHHNTYAQRRDLVLWFKKNYPNIPIVALLASNSVEAIPEADVNVPVDDPGIWVAAVKDLLGKAAGA